MFDKLQSSVSSSNSSSQDNNLKGSPHLLLILPKTTYIKRSLRVFLLSSTSKREIICVLQGKCLSVPRQKQRKMSISQEQILISNQETIAGQFIQDSSYLNEAGTIICSLNTEFMNKQIKFLESSSIAIQKQEKIFCQTWKHKIQCCFKPGD